MASEVSDPEAMKILGELINEEIDLYDRRDMEDILHACFEIFTRSLLMKFLKP